MNFNEEFKKYYDQFVKDLTGLLQIPSVLDKFDKDNLDAPFGKGIKDALDYMLELGKKDGFITKNVDNYAGEIVMGEGEETLAVLCHLDVVPVPGNWTYPPFSATLVDDVIYARGAMDDKGPTMSAYYAMKMLKDNNVKLNKKVKLIVGCDEESGSRCLDYYLKHEPMPELGFSPDADFPLIYGEKGIANFAFKGKEASNALISFKAGVRSNVVPDVCEATIAIDLKNEFNEYLKKNNYQGEIKDNKYITYGKNAHGAMPYLGLNAASLMFEFLVEYIDSKFLDFGCKYLTFDHYGAKLGIKTYDEEMKDLTINPAIFEYENGSFHIVCNIRYPKNFEFISKMAEVERISKVNDIEFVVLGNSPYHYVSPEDPLVKTLHDAYKKYTNDDTPIMTIGGGTYARELKKAVAFGPQFPGREESIHQVDEHAYLIDLIKAAYIYYEAIKNLCD